MRKLLIAAMMFGTPAFAAGEWRTVDEFQSDLEQAKPCKPVDGRLFWKGKKAFYIQAWEFSRGGPLSNEAASTMAFSDMKQSDLKHFSAYCK